MSALVDLGLSHPGAQILGWTPSSSATRRIAPLSRTGAASASSARPRGPLSQLIGVPLLSHGSDPSVLSLPPSNPGQFIQAPRAVLRTVGALVHGLAGPVAISPPLDHGRGHLESLASSPQRPALLNHASGQVQLVRGRKRVSADYGCLLQGRASNNSPRPTEALPSLQRPQSPPDPCHSNEKPGCQHSTPPNLCKSGMIQVLEVLVSYRRGVSLTRCIRCASSTISLLSARLCIHHGGGCGALNSIPSLASLEYPMVRSRSTAFIFAAMFAASSTSFISGPAIAAERPVPNVSYCFSTVDDSCPFPDFRMDEMPAIVAGRSVTFSGVGANQNVLPGVTVEVRGGFDQLGKPGDSIPLSSEAAVVNGDGTWTLTVNAPSQDQVDRFGPFMVWVDVRASGDSGLASSEITYPVVVQPDPAMSTRGWHQINGTWYWGNAQGELAKGWNKVDGTWYLFDSTTGAMRTGWVKDGGSWYYLTGSGAMATGWVRDGGSWYYLTGSGAMATGWLVVDGRWSLFAPNGAWQHYG